MASGGPGTGRGRSRYPSTSATSVRSSFTPPRCTGWSKGRERDRRPTRDELDRICAAAEANPLQVIPLARIVRFAVATALRQEEICAIAWLDLDAADRTVTVRDRKDPRQKAGNDQRVPLLDVTGYDAMALLEAQRAACPSRGRIFP